MACRTLLHRTVHVMVGSGRETRPPDWGRALERFNKTLGKHLGNIWEPSNSPPRWSLDGDKVCQMTLPREVRRIEAESACLNPTKFSTGPTNSMYQKKGSQKPCGTSGTQQMRWKES